jgi:uncharacterized protein YcbX
MRGEELTEMFARFSGVDGDRLFAFCSSAGHADFPYLTARIRPDMILFRPRFRDSDLTLEVETPTGQTIAIDDPALIDALGSGIDETHHLTLRRAERPMTDCQPLSIISLQTIQTLAEETGAGVDQRRFRANVYLNLDSGGGGFSEDRFVGHSLRLGSTVIASVVKRDVRCSIITLDPDTAEKTPALLKTVAQAHDGAAGIYAEVVAEGIVRQGDVVELLD